MRAEGPPYVAVERPDADTAFFAGCIMRTAFGDTERATVRMLERGGHRVSACVEASRRGAEFLRRAQLPTGEFRTLLSADPRLLADPVADSSPFATTFVLQAPAVSVTLAKQQFSASDENRAAVNASRSWPSESGVMVLRRIPWTAVSSVPW